MTKIRRTQHLAELPASIRISRQTTARASLESTARYLGGKLEHEFLRGGARSKNEEIAREISCLDGALEVDKNDVRQRMANAQCTKEPACSPL